MRTQIALAEASAIMVEMNQNDLRRCYRLSVEAMEKAVMEKGIYRESEFERLHVKSKMGKKFSRRILRDTVGTCPQIIS